MKKHMAHVLILEFYEETVYDCKKLIKSSLKVCMWTSRRTSSIGTQQDNDLVDED